MRTQKIFKTLAIGLLTAASLTGCSLMQDDLADCVEASPEATVYKVRFRYDMNMKFADAFAHEVEAVSLVVLDDNNQVVWRGNDSGSALAEEEYALTVPVDPGKYRLLAWCTTNAQDTYTFDYSNRSMDGFGCTLNVTGSRDYSVDHDLDALYHGLMDNVEFPDEPGEHVVTMPLTKDTNRFRVVLQHLSGEPIEDDAFSFSIEADNAVLAYDNSVIDGNNVTYLPWHTSSASFEDDADAADSDVYTDQQATDAADDDTPAIQVNVFIAELTVNRLVMEDNPRLTVTNNKTGKKVFSIPVKDYVLMVKGYENAQMADQEYLDRQDEYNMTFFLDERDRWYDAYIYINSWRVVLQKNAIQK
jgi:hypothetical protein